MILWKYSGAACVLAMSTGMASAVEVTGGEVGLSYSRFFEDVEIDGDDEAVAKTSLSGQVEIGFNRNFALQADLAHHKFSASDEDGTTLTLHGILHYNDTLSFGAFIGRDSGDGDDLDFYGIEIGQEFERFDVEAYLSDGDIDDISSGLIYGVSGRYVVNDALEVGLDFDAVDLDEGADLRRIGLVADYSFGPSTNVYGEIGTSELESSFGSDSEEYVELGAKFMFGAERGATFDKRGFFSVLPGL
ncbi:porin [Maribius pontilimi]|uniref:Porin n=1 Tax=Palleronia pontilimi TaxID=1964209 RepID=A0A934ICT9_9RHOB|nr:porin [Palleronia pontilimi]MBJ3762082.1 porin [Palleronia pontilimi]